MHQLVNTQGQLVILHLLVDEVLIRLTLKAKTALQKGPIADRALTNLRRKLLIWRANTFSTDGTPPVVLLNDIPFIF